MPVIELHNVTKSYQLGKTEVHALRGIDLSIESGEFAVLSGPSGSGKTTILNILGCLDAPTSGEYRIDGDPVAIADFDDLAEVRNEKIGFIFQTFNLVPVLNVLENIELPMLVRPHAWGSRNDRQARARQLAEQVGLGKHIHHRPDELSGGQRQRVAIARALATSPRIVLADEPTASVDSDTAASLLDLMQRLNREQGVTFLFSTHDPRVVARATRLIYIEDGRIVDKPSSVAHAA